MESSSLFYRLAVNEESSYRQVQSTELDTVNTKLILLEERSQHFLSTLVTLRSSFDDEAERAANWSAQFKHDLSNVQLALQVNNYNLMFYFHISLSNIRQVQEVIFLFSMETTIVLTKRMTIQLFMTWLFFYLYMHTYIIVKPN